MKLIVIMEDIHMKKFVKAICVLIWALGNIINLAFITILGMICAGISWESGANYFSKCLDIMTRDAIQVKEWASENF
jgi:hypothetical protein